MRTYFDIIPRPVVRVVPALVVQLNRVLFCDTCKKWLPHALTASGKQYVCGCGAEIIYLKLGSLF